VISRLVVATAASCIVLVILLLRARLLAPIVAYALSYEALARDLLPGPFPRGSMSHPGVGL
jgi:hypothetical protein